MPAPDGKCLACGQPTVVNYRWCPAHKAMLDAQNGGYRCTNGRSKLALELELEGDPDRRGHLDRLGELAALRQPLAPEVRRYVKRNDP